MATKMDVDGDSANVMASTAATGSVVVSLHPLVIMNVSEHWTRVRAQEGKPVQGKVDLYISVAQSDLCLPFLSCWFI